MDGYGTPQNVEHRKIVPTRIVSMAVCPTDDVTLLSAADKFGNVGLWNVVSKCLNINLY